MRIKYKTIYEEMNDKRKYAVKSEIGISAIPFGTRQHAHANAKVMMLKQACELKKFSQLIEENNNRIIHPNYKVSIAHKQQQNLYQIQTFLDKRNFKEKS